MSGYRPPIHPDLTELRFDEILRVYAAAAGKLPDRATEALDQLVISHQLWDLFEQRYPELAAEHRAAVDVSLNLRNKG